MHFYDEEQTRHPHPYLSGNFAPIHRALPLTPCSYTGTIPEELRGGQYVRNGGNPVTNEDLGRDAHWFDGDGMLAGVAFLEDDDDDDEHEDGAEDETENEGGTGTGTRKKIRPSFVNQYLLTDLYVSSLTSEHLKRPILPSIATLVNPVTSFLTIMWVVCRTVLFVILSRLPGSEIAIKKISVANTAVIYHDGRALATCESGPPLRFTLPTLETVGWFTGDRAENEPEKGRSPDEKAAAAPVQDIGHGSQFGHSGPIGFMREWTTAHPRVDPVTKELLAFHSTFIPPYIHYSIVPDTRIEDSAGDVARPRRRMMNAPVPGVSAARMMHDFGVSRHHTVIMDLPLSLDPTNSFRGRPVVEYDVNGTSRFGVFPRWQPDKIRWFETRACSIFHTANTWEGEASAPAPSRTGTGAGSEMTTVPTVEMLACRLTSASLVFSAGDVAAPAVTVEPKHPEEDQCRLYYYCFDMSQPPPSSSASGDAPSTTTPSNRILHQYALSAIPFEFPSLRPSAEMAPARFVYGCSMSGTGSFTAALGRATKIDVLVKLDALALIRAGHADPPTEVSGVVDRRSVDEVHRAATAMRAAGTPERVDRRIMVFVMPAGWYCQEPRFVPRRRAPRHRSGAEARQLDEGGRSDGAEADEQEDDGYLLTYAFDESQLCARTGEAPPTAMSELWIVDGADMASIVARVRLPQRVPYGLHGAWFGPEMVRDQRAVADLRRLPVSLERRKREQRWERERRERRARLEESLPGMAWGWVREGIERALG